MTYKLWPLATGMAQLVKGSISLGTWCMFAPGCGGKQLEALQRRAGNILFANSDWLHRWCYWTRHKGFEVDLHRASFTLHKSGQVVEYVNLDSKSRLSFPPLFLKNFFAIMRMLHLLLKLGLLRTPSVTFLCLMNSSYLPILPIDATPQHCLIDDFNNRYRSRPRTTALVVLTLCMSISYMYD